MFGVCLAYRDSANTEVLELLQFYINSILSLFKHHAAGSAHQAQPNANGLFFEWMNGNREHIVLLLFVCLLGLGLVFRASNHTVVLHFLSSLIGVTIDSSSIHQTQFHLTLSLAISLVLSQDALPFCGNFITVLENRLLQPHTPCSGLFFSTGVTVVLLLLSHL